MPHFLAQSLNIPTPTPLPSPPLLTHLLLESPLPLVLLLLAAGFTLAWTTRTAPTHRSGRFAIATLLLGAGPALLLTATWITTDREAMRNATAQLVAAATKPDIPRLDPMLAPDCYLFSRFGFPGYRVSAESGMDKSSILDQLPRTLREYPIAEHTIRETQSQSRGPNLGSTQIFLHIVVEAQKFRIPVESWWRIDWRRSPDGTWQATSIQALTNPAGK